MSAEIPPREIWLSPHCEKCSFLVDEVTWCRHNIYDACPDCGKKSIRYVIDKRQLKGRSDE